MFLFKFFGNELYLKYNKVYMRRLLGFFILIASIMLTSCTQKVPNKAPVQISNNSTTNMKIINNIDDIDNIDINNSSAILKPNSNNKDQSEKGTRSIPVLMYHSVEYEKDNPVRIPTKNFREQMKYLYDNNYKTLSLDDLNRYFEGEIEIPEKSLVITFDDGYEDNYINAYPILKEYGFKATIFAITNTIDKDSSYLTTNQLIEMQQNGIDIESHTVSHVKLGELPYEKQLSEFKNSKEILEKLLNKKVNYIAYPFGSYNENTLKAIKEAGYDMAFTTNGRWSGKDDGIYTLDRVYISGFFNMQIFIERISNSNYKIS